MFQIDRFGRIPIYEQIVEQTEQFIASGALRPGDQLPSVRSLSQTLSANPNTLQKAYSELERRGVTVSVPGNGRYISKEAPRLVDESMQHLLTEITGLCEKLRISGVSKHRAMAAVEAGYTVKEPQTAEHTETRIPAAQGSPDAQITIDTSPDVSRKDTAL